MSDGDTRLTVSATGGAGPFTARTPSTVPSTSPPARSLSAAPVIWAAAIMAARPGSTFTNNGVFVMNTSSNQTFSGVISGTGTFYQNGSGATTLSAANTYTGGTNIGGGTLALGRAAPSTPVLRSRWPTAATFNVTALGTGYQLLGSQTLTATGTTTWPAR